jgi:poly(hydroxyalkanoate) granule-associated protein
LHRGRAPTAGLKLQDDKMVKKLHKSGPAAAGKAAETARDKHMANSVMASAQQIWLAGMGAFSRAQSEGGKVFETLMKEGQNLQRKTQGLAEDKIHDVTGKMTSMAGEVQSKAGQHWDKLESIFEQRTAKAMAKLGVPTAKDVDALIQRVDDLAQAVARLAGGAVVARKAAKPAAAAKPVAKAMKRAVNKSAATQVAAKTAASKALKAASQASSRVARKGAANK